MLKQLLALLLTGVFMLSTMAGNLIKNSDFSDLTNAKLPRNWILRGKILPDAVKNGTLTLGGDAGNTVFAVQYHLPIKPGVNYTMQWFAAGKAPYKCYVEYAYMDNGKKKLKWQHFNLIQPKEQGGYEKFQFSVPAEAIHTYIAFTVKSAGTVTISKLLMQETSEAERTANLLPNSDFMQLDKQSRPIGWNCRGKAENYRFSPGKAEVKGAKTYLVAPLKHLIGRNVEFSCQVSGRGKYRIYAEWYWMENGQKRSRSTRGQWSDAAADGKTFKLAFTIPAEKVTSAVLALQTDSEEFITFSQLAVRSAGIGDFSLSAKKSQEIPLGRLIPGQNYKLSYKVSGRGASGNDTTFHFFQFRLFQRSGSVYKTFPLEDCLERVQNKTITFTAPQSQDVYLKVTSQSAGVLEFKDLKLTLEKKTIDSDRLVITSPCFRNTFYSSMPEKSVAGFAVSDRKITGGKAVLKTPDGKTHTANLVNVDKKWQFSLPGEPGELTVTLAFQDGKNKVLTQKIAKLPPAPVEVISGPDRRFYINGKVFFPLELARNVVPFKEQVYQGGNYVRRAIPSTPEDCLKILDQGVKDNLKIIFSFMNTVPRTVDENKLRLWQHRAENLLSREVLNHPALLGYFLDDEPLWNGVPLASLQRCYDVLRKADPYRPVLICSAPRGTVDELRPYAMCSDVFGVDIYPVPSPSSHSHLEDKSISCVGKYVRRMQEITDFTRPVFVVLQGCAWGDLGGNKNKPRIYPTLTESRFMAFDAVINQVDMIFWWGLWYSANPEFYDELTQVTREMHSLTGVFAAANHVPGKVSNKAVEYRRFYGSNWSCTIAANTVNKQVKVIFSNVPGVPATEVSFEPYEVKIFSNGTLPSPLTEIPPLDPKRITFKNQLIAKRDAVTYQAPDGMKWIWGAKEKSIPGSRIFARKTFTVKNGLKKAYLRVSVDDFVLSIVLNKQKLDPGTRFLDDYRYLNNLDISSLLKTGSNTLCIEAADGAPLPCGLLAEIRLEYADGFVQSIPSDATWETAPAAEGPWSKASVIKNLGDAPWKMPKLLKPIVPVLVKK